MSTPHLTLFKLERYLHAGSTSSKTIITELAPHEDPRAHYLGHARSLPPPCIACSSFVPLPIVEHLMRRKKNSALGVKFQPNNNPPDAITNMEGALHSFVVAIVRAYMHGDYRYANGHGVTCFPLSSDKKQRAREVLVSCLIQPDFEYENILFTVAELKDEEIRGKDFGPNFAVQTLFNKQDRGLRTAYDNDLRLALLWNLTAGQKLPGLKSGKVKVFALNQVASFIEEAISESHDLVSCFINHGVILATKKVLSLELLFNCAVQQYKAEISLLESICARGYVYTWDPPSIFARCFDSWTLTLLQLAALKYISDHSSFSRMKVFAFNDYAHPRALKNLRLALRRQSHMAIVAKKELFSGPGGTYKCLPDTERAMVVIHNNSDAFGQNIETEGPGGSLDGAVGANSSTAASLRRDRPDLLRFFCKLFDM